MAFSFKTSPIRMSSEEYMYLVNYLESMRVHHSNFILDNGETMFDEDRMEPLDGNRVYGSPIHADVDVDNETVVIYADGGLAVSFIQSQYGYESMTEVQGTLIDWLFDERFADEHPGVLIYVESNEGGETKTETISLDYFYSKQGRMEHAEKSADTIREKIASINNQITLLENKKNDLGQQLKHFEDYMKSSSITSIEDDNSLPF